MEVLLRDPCCAAGLALLAVGGLVALAVMGTVKLKAWWRDRNVKEVRDA